ncbi:hypothetical protein [Marinilactibacillus psychrotolerans]|uniref:Phage protein n=1 Tax=Marinilactibacillus psychrotolerans TaxID=191770 RepID=A0AAV3WQF4_9LACT|nr:hypothetical protein [Marinilactibacillus psychrotolerans]GEL67230.1 hypothetical protein MPS01_13850 [Marinilactibacillus psychrotolerans]GEQ36034.1 phage protein [Marinilactibacillus psychrotolerans]SDC60698.1 hypothetical protein SAMN04488013_10746 [Marinilactibacillus psychrotolerans]
MTKNTLGDLNNHLFEQLERLNDDSLTEEELQQELKRSDAMSKIATNLVNNANTILKAQTVYDNSIDANAKKPRMLEGSD